MWGQEPNMIRNRPETKYICLIMSQDDLYFDNVALTMFVGGFVCLFILMCMFRDALIFPKIYMLKSNCIKSYCF